MLNSAQQNGKKKANAASKKMLHGKEFTLSKKAADTIARNYLKKK